MSLCMHQAACKLCREHLKLAPCVPSAAIPCDGSLYVACMQLCLCTRAAPPCSSSMQGFRRSQVPAIKDVKVGQLVSKSERCRVYRGTLQGKTAVIKVGRPTKTCLTAAPMGTTAPFTRERPCFCGCGPSRLPGKPAHAADH